MEFRISLRRLVFLVLQCLLGTALGAQTNSCKLQFQYFCHDPLIPGATYDTEGACLAIGTVNTAQCPAICWDCVLGTSSAGQPINLANGDTFITQTDLNIPGLGGGLTLSRTWHSEFPFGEAVPTTGMFGGKWRSTYEESIFVETGGLVKYVRGTGGIWTLGLVGVSWPLSYTMIAPANGKVSLGYDGTYWTITFNSGEKRVFNTAGRLLSLSDRNGNSTQLTYDSSNRLTTVTDPASRHLYFSYANSSSTLVVGVTSDAGVSLSYGYDGQGRLATITKPDLTTVSFQFDANSLISAVLDTTGKVLEAHTYDGELRGLTSSRAGGADAMTITYPFLWLP